MHFLPHHRLLQSTDPSLVFTLLLQTHFKINLRFTTMNSPPTRSLTTCMHNTIIITIRRMHTSISTGELHILPTHHHSKQQIIVIIIIYQQLHGHSMQPYDSEATRPLFQDNRRSPVPIVIRQIDVMISIILIM